MEERDLILVTFTYSSLLEILVASTPWSPVGLSRLVQGYLYLLLRLKTTRCADAMNWPPLRSATADVSSASTCPTDECSDTVQISTGAKHIQQLTQPVQCALYTSVARKAISLRCPEGLPPVLQTDMYVCR
jgi:hypothetical protein